MPTPTEHKTVQARILAYAEAIGCTFVSEEKKVIGDSRLEIGEGKKRRGIGDSKLECGVIVSEFYTGEATSWHGRRQIGDRREDFDSESLSSLRFSISEFKGFDRRERRDRKEDLDRAKGFGGTSREFVEHLRNPPSRKSYGETSRAGFFDHEEKREREVNHE